MACVVYMLAKMKTDARKSVMIALSGGWSRSSMIVDVVDVVVLDMGIFLSFRIVS
jgi:hypothetical protein